MKGFRFKGKHSNEFGIVVESVTRPLMSSLDPKTVKIPNRAGQFFFGIEKGMRVFTVKCHLIIENTDWIWDLAHDINSWLVSDEEEELIFDHETDITYYAFVSGETPLEKSYTHGTFDLTFVCPDPYGYGPEFESAEITASPTNVTIAGYEPTHPIVVANFTEPSTYFTLATKHAHIHLGSPAGVTETKVAKEVKRISDRMTSLASWVNHGTIENGTPSGSFRASGYAFEVQDFGTGTEWHGPCVKRSVATPFQNFKMEARLQFASYRQNEVGRMDIYMLDVNGNIIARIGVRDAWGNERTTIEARAGNLLNGKTLVHFVGDIRTKKRKVVTKKKVKGKTVDTTSYVTDGWSTYSDFYGMLRMTRIGKRWTVYSAKIDKKTGRHHTRKTVGWTDTKSLYTDQVAGIAIHIGQHGTKPVINSTRFYDIILTQINTVTTEDVPEIIDAGDEITIDCETGAVLKNGEQFTEELHISSEFFPLNPGINNIAFEPDDKCNIKVYHRGKYM